MEIPKKISYCWFGGNVLPDKVLRCIESWKRICPEYEIIRWDESNYNIDKIPYIRDAYKEKRWAFVADYARLDIIHEIGGIYLDTDVELIKKPDNLLKTGGFMCIEKDGFYVNTGLGFAAEAGNRVVKELMDVYSGISFYKSDHSLNLKACPIYTTELLEKAGYIREDKMQKIKGIDILPSEYFCPLDYQTGKMKITENTIGIHWYDASWISDSDKKIFYIERKIKKVIPGRIGRALCKIYRNGYRLVEYTSEGILIDRIKKRLKNK